MITWIDIENSNGDKLGDGPLTAVLSSMFGEALSEAAKFNFTILASDPRIDLVNYERVAVRYIVMETGITIRQSGIIKSINLTLSEGLPAYEVSGLNLLYELSYTLVNIELFDYKMMQPHIFVEDEGVLHTKWVLFDDNPETYEEIRISANDHFLVVCCVYPFDQIHFSIKDGNETQTAFGWFWRGENWVELGTTDNLIDTMVDHLAGEDNPRPLRRSGMIGFNAPQSWRHRNFNHHIDLNGDEVYPIRFDPMYGGPGETVEVTIRDIKVRGKGPTNNDLLPILTGSGWGLSGHQSTGEPTRMFLWDISILASFVKLAEYRGHAFRQAQGGRFIEWLRTEDIGADCGVVIIAAPSGQVVRNHGDDVCYILNARRLIESYDVVTAVKAYSGGIGTDRFTCKGATWTPPEGYYFDESSGLVISAYAENIFGRRIEKVEQFGLVSSGVDFLGNKDVSEGPNELLRAAVAWLQKHDKPHRAFDVEVIGLKKLLKVGQNIKVQYYDPAQRIFLDDSLYILAIDIHVSQQGIVTHRLTISSVPYWPQENNDFLVNTRQMLQELLGYEQGVPNVETVSTRASTTSSLLTDEELEQLELIVESGVQKINDLKTDIDTGVL